MKKLIGILLTCVLVVGYSMVALADKTTNGNIDTLSNSGRSPTETSTKDVTGIYVKSSPGIVYCVDITWGSMQFTYNASEVWNPDTHNYTSSGAWTVAIDNVDNQIKVVNHSNTDIVAQLEYTQIVTSVSGKFTDETGRVERTTAKVTTAEGRTKTQPPWNDAYLHLNGNPGTKFKNQADKRLGQVVITIT